MAAAAADLSHAFAECPGTRQAFDMGEQCDAAEALECLLRSLDEALLPAGASQAGYGMPTLLKHICGLCVDEVCAPGCACTPITQCLRLCCLSRHGQAACVLL